MGHAWLLSIQYPLQRSNFYWDVPVCSLDRYPLDRQSRCYMGRKNILHKSAAGMYMRLPNRLLYRRQQDRRACNRRNWRTVLLYGLHIACTELLGRHRRTSLRLRSAWHRSKREFYNPLPCHPALQRKACQRTKAAHSQASAFLRPTACRC